MSKEDIVNVMSESEGEFVVIIDAKDEEIRGNVFLYETRYDNEEDEDCAGEASICVECDNGDSCMLYESDIKHIKIVA